MERCHELARNRAVVYIPAVQGCGRGERPQVSWVVGPPSLQPKVGVVNFHSYLIANAGGNPAPIRGPRPGRRRPHPGDGGARLHSPRPRSRPQRYPGIPSLLRP